MSTGTQALKETVTGVKVSPVTNLSNFLNRLKPQIALALPKHLNADRMVRLGLTAFSTTPALQKCTPESIAASLMIASQLGLEPGVNGAAFLVPYGSTCTLVPGWKGLVDLATRSGRGTVFTGVIYSDQHFSFRDGARRDLEILNQTELDSPDDITHAYAVGWVRGSDMPVIELQTVAKIRAHRDKYNKQGKAHYSYKHWEAYCRKICLQGVLKYMPASIEMSMAMDVVSATDVGKNVLIEDGIVIDTDTGEMHGSTYDSDYAPSDVEAIKAREISEGYGK